MEKAANPFKYGEKYPEVAMERLRELELANIGPGKYSPIKDEIGGNPLKRDKLKHLQSGALTNVSIGKSSTDFT